MGFSRFNKRWASSGQVETITENNANLGLAFLGDEPPSAELHNQMFQWLDEKDNYLFNLLDEVKRERTGTGLSASPLTQLADAIATAATTTKAGIQPNATGAQTSAMASAAHTVTPASLKPLIDSLVLGIANSVPSGGVLAFARSSAPAGWLVADGSAVSRSTYVDLFNAIGTTFGSGNGSTTFNLPNIQGAVVRGWNGSGSGVDTGRAFGSMQQPQNQAHTHGLTLNPIAAHTHTFTTQGAGGHTHTHTMGANGGHSHTSSTASAGNHTHSASTGADGSHAHNGTTTSGGAHTHYVTDSTWTPTVGADTTGNSNEPRKLTNYGASNTYGNYLTSSDGAHSHTFTTSTIGNHTHTVSIAADGAHTHAVSVNAVADHIHSLTINAVADHAHSGTTAAAGGTTPTGSIAQEGGENRVYNIALLYCIKI